MLCKFYVTLSTFYIVGFHPCSPFHECNFYVNFMSPYLTSILLAFTHAVHFMNVIFM